MTTIVSTNGDPVTIGDRAPNLATFDFTRGNGNALNNRTISGAVFDLSDITFTGGFDHTIAIPNTAPPRLIALSA